MYVAPVPLGPRTSCLRLFGSGRSRHSVFHPTVPGSRETRKRRTSPRVRISHTQQLSAGHNCWASLYELSGMSRSDADGVLASRSSQCPVESCE
ncbi:hypothetical protein BD311DRAFT_118296 [Dichomitus squalens]|uniref:Uncharacterized protein n=1 Tax=Dichomitus squalens TaxID=114155 RepID=A0A4Q9MU13_9APHY|nr:hypothetical protein BD311DRAFT_118296 [Dichomitus squalens]